MRLQQHGLSAGVIEVMMGSRAESTSKLYAAKWSVFVGWCAERRVQPESCAVELILEFLRSMFDKGRAASTIRVYAAAISACHEGFPRGAVFSHPYVKRFLKGCVRLRPVVRTVVPSWDLQLVLRALCRAPFEPLAQVPLKVLSVKTALLLALSSAKRVGDLCALSVSESCMAIAGDASRATLRPNAAFVPKVVTSTYRSRVITLEGFSLPPHLTEEEERLHCLCPVRALACYVERTKGLRRSTQLFVCYGQGALGQALSSQRLSHWLCDCITSAYESAGGVAPEGLRAHSTRGLAASTALLRGVCVQDICTAASWASPSSFVQAYLRDTSAGSLSRSVLSVASGHT